ncbi:MAG TPA: thiamine phosphate synthase [Opitutaceae bacterium]|nr:thiamine phosphate synthase [Opitutaceae bacterium]
MQIVVISPESRDPREVPAMKRFFAEGLERYHVRKPSWTARELEAWLRLLPGEWRPRMILHEHHSLVEELGLGGRHDKDTAPGGRPPPGGSSRSCHDLPSLRRHLMAYDSVLFGPVFPSLSKPGYGPPADFPWYELWALMRQRRRTAVAGFPGPARVLAIGGITVPRLARCFEIGFDGAAVLGAVWNDSDPARAFERIRNAAARLEGARYAA